MRRGRMNAAVSAVVVGVVLAWSSGAFAQGRSGAATAPGYDLKAEVTLQMTVTEIKRAAGPGGQGGVHLTVISSSGVVAVDLGPEWFLTERKYAFAIGDDLTVTGARIKRNGGDALVAREIKRGAQTMQFRDPKGFPLWAGRGRGSR